MTIENGFPLRITLPDGSEIRPIEAPRTNPEPEKTDPNEPTFFSGQGGNLDDFPEFKKLFGEMRNKKFTRKAPLTPAQVSARLARLQLQEKVIYEFGKLSNQSQKEVLEFILDRVRFELGEGE